MGIIKVVSLTRVLLITGGSAGIGLSTASRFLKDDYNVVCLSRRPCPLEGVEHLRCDLAQPDFLETIRPALEPLLSQADSISVIHNASRLSNDIATDTPSDEFRDVLEINIVAPNTLNRFVIPFMKQGSSVLFVGSTLSEKAVPGSYSYVTTKHGMIGMMRSLCQDLAGTGIHTACVCPGFTDTEMLREHVPSDAIEAVSNMSAFGRLIEPTEIAETLFWATSNPVINGSVLHANLGQIET
jgi:NAD(P)-dependent dehydrogenase (short-subunit alcohol dehydrogenase family)